MKKFNFDEWHNAQFGYGPMRNIDKAGLYYEEVERLLASLHSHYEREASARGATLDGHLDQMAEEYLSKKDKL